jgi:hypothetical protein
MSELGTNVKVDVKNNKMVITVDLKADRTLSKSGKSNIIASTQGNKDVPNGNEIITVGLNVYTKV